jgi:hypothetical protein
MSLQLGLRDAGRNESQADIRLLIPRIYSVNPDVSDGAQSRSTAGRPHGSLTAIEQSLNLNRIDREISRDLLGGKAHIEQGPE